MFQVDGSGSGSWCECGEGGQSNLSLVPMVSGPEQCWECAEWTTPGGALVCAVPGFHECCQFPWIPGPDITTLSYATKPSENLHHCPLHPFKIARSICRTGSRPIVASSPRQCRTPHSHPASVFAMMTPTFFISILLIFAVPLAEIHANPLCASRLPSMVDELLSFNRNSSMKGSIWSVDLRVLPNGGSGDWRSLVSVNNGMLLLPASNNKIITAAASLAYFRPDHRWVQSLLFALSVNRHDHHS